MPVNKSLVMGVGINDADYRVTLYTSRVNNPDRPKKIWVCPFYSRWKGVLSRCYGESSLKKFPTYHDCYVCDEWLYFSNFRAWMEVQDWEEKHLDKDILLPGNRVYSPETCVFVSKEVNAFTNENYAKRGKLPIGVSWYGGGGPKVFTAQCHCLTLGRGVTLGYYETAEDAHKAWLSFKLKQAEILAARQTDPRVAAALVWRYENYPDQFINESTENALS